MILLQFAILPKDEILPGAVEGDGGPDRVLVCLHRGAYGIAKAMLLAVHRLHLFRQGKQGCYQGLAGSRAVRRRAAIRL